ncbi:hypothetical protein CB0940_05479 [Cercospora beticola]|uniref:F-box domain-containing protein n=1 Tax=Cercospora beticola TaxID=122368 RepID=A0A2G5HY71_CERBT|nr:hypothetical protein CB0940_05479 [Cercospora beticola]PIA97460.1 hypothetical protein CB0940_05479 [Cercospora beticola]WPA98030.1 hypothetical protein RHO25_002641 [Cercospora beticola]CAK1359239.1 unnamed protein product [Cercospora beticola]
MTDSTIESSTAINDLPAEIFEHVGKFLPARDLAALRVVNRDSNSKILRHYVTENFSTVSILVCDINSIRAAADLVEHPVFGPAIRRVELCVDSIVCNSTMPPRGPREAPEAIYQHCEVSADISKLEALNRERTNMSLDIGDYEDEKLFRQIWQKLKALGTLEAVHLTDVRVASRSPLLYSKFQAAGGFCYPVILDSNTLQWTICALGTLTKSSIPLQSLSMDQNRWALTINEGGWTRGGRQQKPYEDRKMWPRLFSRTKALRLAIFQKHCYRDSPLGSGFALFLRYALADAASLEKLSLELASSKSEDEPDQWHMRYDQRCDRMYLLHGINLPPGLKELELRGGQIVMAELADLIKGNPRLQKLALKKTVLIIGDNQTEHISDGQGEDEQVKEGLLQLVGETSIELDISAACIYVGPF